MVCLLLLVKKTKRWEERRNLGGVVYRNNSGCAISNIEVVIVMSSMGPAFLTMAPAFLTDPNIPDLRVFPGGVLN